MVSGASMAVWPRRIDPSDVVQETLFEASRKLTDYIRDPIRTFLSMASATGLEATLRSVRETHSLPKSAAYYGRSRNDFHLSEQSVQQLANRLMSSGTTPSRLPA